MRPLSPLKNEQNYKDLNEFKIFALDSVHLLHIHPLALKFWLRSLKDLEESLTATRAIAKAMSQYQNSKFAFLPSKINFVFKAMYFISISFLGYDLLFKWTK